ncbi:hypothetical protein JNK13_08220 [bacterium]|nr:hypothetical protein [bacterium]
MTDSFTGEKFIFVFLDDGTLDVVSPRGDLMGAYEGIDVGNGEYTFFDDQLRKMVANFTKPNREGKLLGFISWVQSGEYELKAEQPSKKEFIYRLSFISSVNPNSWFKTIEEIREYAGNLPDTDENFSPSLEGKEKFIGKYLLVGLDYLDTDGNLDRQEQVHGVIISIDQSGLIIRKSDGSEFNLPPALANLESAAEGIYRLRGTGEEVIDPDYLMNWTIRPPKEEV